jgi:hypothetical protein
MVVVGLFSSRAGADCLRQRRSTHSPDLRIAMLDRWHQSLFRPRLEVLVAEWGDQIVVPARLG